MRSGYPHSIYVPVPAWRTVNAFLPFVQRVATISLIAAHNKFSKIKTLLGFSHSPFGYFSKGCLRKLFIIKKIYDLTTISLPVVFERFLGILRTANYLSLYKSIDSHTLLPPYFLYFYRVTSHHSKVEIRKKTLRNILINKNIRGHGDYNNSQLFIGKIGEKYGSRSVPVSPLCPRQSPPKKEQKRCGLMPKVLDYLRDKPILGES